MLLSHRLRIINIIHSRVKAILKITKAVKRKRKIHYL